MDAHWTPEPHTRPQPEPDPRDYADRSRKVDSDLEAKIARLLATVTVVDPAEEISA